MKTKTVLLAITACLVIFAASCNSNKETKIESIPSGANIEEAYNKVVEKAALSKAELYELKVTFKKTRSEGSNSDASLSLSINNPDKVGELLEYTYDIRYNQFSEINTSSLKAMNNRGGQKSVASYDDYSYALFTTNDFPAFSKFDNLYNTAIEKSGFDKTTAYVFEVWARFEPVDNEFQFVVKVQRSAEQSNDEDITLVYFDKSGNVVKSILYKELFN